MLSLLYLAFPPTSHLKKQEHEEGEWVVADWPLLGLR